MARSQNFGAARVKPYRRLAVVAGCLDNRVLTEAGRDADSINCAPGPELTSAQRQSMLARRHERQPMSSHDAVVRVQRQRPASETVDFRADAPVLSARSARGMRCPVKIASNDVRVSTADHVVRRNLQMLWIGRR